MTCLLIGEYRLAFEGEDSYPQKGPFIKDVINFFDPLPFRHHFY